MSSVENKVQFGAKVNYALAPKEGFEIEAVEVFNQTADEVVSSQLTKTSDNPLRYVCSFIQPAGVVAIRPKIKPILYSVIIEECENCNIVLVESNDNVDITIVSAAANTTDSGEKIDVPDEEASAELQTEVLSEQEDVNTNVMSEATSEGTDDEQNSADQGESANFNMPQHSAQTEVHADEASDVEEETINDADEKTQDKVYDAGEFQGELEDVEPIVITEAEVDKKNKAYWQHRNAYNAGQISKKDFEEVEKKHMEFLDAISTGLIKVQERDT